MKTKIYHIKTKIYHMKTKIYHIKTDPITQKLILSTVLSTGSLLFGDFKFIISLN